MGSVTIDYRQIIEKLLQEYADFLNQDDGIEQELIFDREHNRSLLLETGWQNNKRIYGPFIHIDIKDDKLWIEHDGSEDGIAYGGLRHRYPPLSVLKQPGITLPVPLHLS